MAIQTIVILIVRVTTPPISTDGITIGMMTLLGSSSTLNFDVESNKALVMGVGTVSVVTVLYSSVKLVSVPGTVQLNFAVMKKDLKYDMLC